MFFSLINCTSENKLLNDQPSLEKDEKVELGYAMVNIDFINNMGDPYEAKRVVISDGKGFYKEFNNVYSIEEKVPNICAYRFVWNSFGYDTQDQLILDLDSKEYDFNFYCLDRSKTLDRIESYVLIEEKGTDAKLISKWDEAAQKMSLKLEGQPGKVVDVVTWIDTDLLTKPNYALYKMEVHSDDKYNQRIGQDFSICIPPNVNYTLSWVTAPTEELNPVFDFYFQEISDEYVFVDIRESLVRDFIISENQDLKKKQILVESLDGKRITSKYHYPQFAVEEGVYFLKPEYIDTRQYVSPKIPVKVEKNKASIFEYYPIPINELKNDVCFLTAEYYHTITKVSAAFSKDKVIMRSDSFNDKALEYTNYYYASIILDKSDQVKDVSCYFENGTSILLKNNYDYVILEYEDWKILTLRVPYSSRELIVRK